MRKKAKVVQQKQLYERVKNWYYIYRQEREALHEISALIPFKAYHRSGAMELMFEELIRERKVSDTHLKKLVREMFHLINKYAEQFFKDNPNATIEDMDKLEDEDLYS